MDNNQQPSFPTSIEETIAEIIKLGIDHKICDINVVDFSVNVHGNVNISNKELKYFPVMFNRIHGDFNFSYNQLISLKGSPKIVDGIFDCSSNYLESLQYCPEKVTSFIANLNKLTEIDFLPQQFGYLFLEQNQITHFSENLLNNTYNLCKTIRLSHNQMNNLKTLIKCPNLEELLISDNKLNSLEHTPQMNKLIDLNISSNELETLVTNFAPNLLQLNANGNKLVEIDTSFLEKLTLLDLKDNDFKTYNQFLNFRKQIALYLDYNKMDIDTLIKFCETYGSAYLSMLRIVTVSFPENPSQQTILRELKKVKVVHDKKKIIMEHL